MEVFDRMRSAQGQIAKDGTTSTDRFGQLKAHPLLPTERDSRAAMLQALKLLHFDIEPLKGKVGRPGGANADETTIDHAALDRDRSGRRDPPSPHG